MNSCELALATASRSGIDSHTTVAESAPAGRPSSRWISASFSSVDAVGRSISMPCLNSLMSSRMLRWSIRETFALPAPALSERTAAARWSTPIRASGPARPTNGTTGSPAVGLRGGDRVRLNDRIDLALTHKASLRRR